MIVSSAVKLSNGMIFPGKRHGDCYEMIKVVLGDKECCKGSIQGFLTDSLEFLNREEAYYHAFSCKQCSEQKYNKELFEVYYKTNNGLYISEGDWHPVLFSEDLW